MYMACPRSDEPDIVFNLPDKVSDTPMVDWNDDQEEPMAILILGAIVITTIGLCITVALGSV